MSDLLSLLPVGVSGVIVGRALYDGTVILSEALQAVADGRLQDASGPKAPLADSIRWVHARSITCYRRHQRSR